MLDIKIKNETSRLLAVIVGVANDFGGVPDVDSCYDPKSRENVLAGTFPEQEDVIQEMGGLISVLEKYKVDIFRPHNIVGLNQIFSRDIAFVIEEKIILANTIDKRKQEIDGISKILDMISDKDKVSIPESVRIEGGDVIVCNDFLFVGYSKQEDLEEYTVARTNQEGVRFLADIFPGKNIKEFELVKSDVNPKENALHLDCCFQPIGSNMAILYKGGFKNTEDIKFIVDYFGVENIIEINKEEMYDMNANIFSISENVIVSEKNFVRLNKALRNRGFVVEEISYSEIAKMEGLLRCSTMPLIRE